MCTLPNVAVLNRTESGKMHFSRRYSQILFSSNPVYTFPKHYSKVISVQ